MGAKLYSFLLIFSLINKLLIDYDEGPLAKYMHVRCVSFFSL
jgi:hypothetical protein